MGEYPAKETNEKIPELIWIDHNIDNQENSYYQNILNDILYLKGFKTIIEGLEEIKKIKFKKVILMISSSLFNQFLPIFEKEKNKICCCLNIIIFTQKEKIFEIEKICNENKNISSGYLFDKTKIFDDIEKIKNYIIKSKEKHIKFTDHFETIDKDNKIYFDEKIDNFEKINNFEELILPLYFHKSIEPITYEEIHNFNYYLLTLYDGKNEIIKDLIMQFDNIPEMPIEIICKYWAYIYTLEGKNQHQNFYQILNSGLRDKNYKLFLPFIKMMYEGVKRNIFTSINDEDLYSGGIISNKELEKIKNNLNDNSRNDNLPKVIYYLRAFKSFSKNRKISEQFIRESSEDSTGLLFILLVDNNDINIEEDFKSNAYIKEFSKYQVEDEVLFFPFSSFEVVKIEDEQTDTKKYVIIYLKYLGRYKKYIEEKKSSQTILKDIPITQFGKDITEIGLINYKFSKYWEVKKEIAIEGNANCVLYIENNKILLSIGAKLCLYDLHDEKLILNKSIHEKEINDLIKINKNFFISSSNDKSIKVIQLTNNNFLEISVVNSINVHSGEVNQTIKLSKNNLYASCSNDKTIQIWKYDLENNNFEIENILRNLCGVFAIYELPTHEIISISKDEYLKFWQYEKENHHCIKSLNYFKKPLHNCIFLLNEKTILIGTKKVIFIIDIDKKQKIKKFTLNYNTYSINYINGNLFLGLKNNKNSCLLFEYIIENKYDEMNLVCIGRGRDLCYEISSISGINEKTIVTCNKYKFIKIWKEIENKPKLLLIENNPDYNFEEDYESDEISEKEEKEEKVEKEVKIEKEEKEDIIKNINNNMSENIDDNENHENDYEELTLGINLGITNIYAAALINGKVEIIPNEKGNYLFPSILSIKDDYFLVGEEAIDQLILNPKNTIYNIMELIGRDFNDNELKHFIKCNKYYYYISKFRDDRIVIEIKDQNTGQIKYYSPENILTYILKKLINSARNYFRQNIKKVVITCPIYFTDKQKNAIKLSADAAGLEILGIKNEPIIASFAYGLDKKSTNKENIGNPNISLFSSNSNKNDKINNNDKENQKLVFIFDLGGKTFNLALLNILNDIENTTKIISKTGDLSFGGNSFDKKICEFCINDFCSKYKIDKNNVERNIKLMNRLKIASEKAKIRLSYELETIIDLEQFYNEKPLYIKLTRILFEEICKDLFEKIVSITYRLLDEAKIGESDINEIILVGGATNIPRIKQIIKMIFYDIKINCSINPDETLAYGAAIYSAELMKPNNYFLNDNILFNTTLFSLGISKKNKNEDPEIENKGNLMNVIIPKGTKIPFSKTILYTINKNIEENIDIDIYEGENKYVKDNIFLGKLSLKNLKIKNNAKVIIKLVFEIKEDGIITVSGEEKSQKIKNSIQIINDKEYSGNSNIIFHHNNINNTNKILPNNNTYVIKNLKKEMMDYCNQYQNSFEKECKLEKIFNFAETVENLLDTFGNEMNDTLGIKYYLYLKLLFKAYNIIIQLNYSLEDKEKNMIINKSKKYLQILSRSHNISYEHYVVLLGFFSINFNEEGTKKSLKIEKNRNYILFQLMIFIMELIEAKAKKTLLDESQFSKSKSKVLFQNCIHLSENFVKSELDISGFQELNEKNNNIITNCIKEIKRITAYSLVDTKNIKKTGRLLELPENISKEELLIILDKYKEALENLKDLNDSESEAIIYATILKINFNYLGNKNYESLKNFAEKILLLIKPLKEKKHYNNWYLETTNILNKLNFIINEEQENLEQFEIIHKNMNKKIFDEIHEYRKKSNIEFIEFILEKYPPLRSPIRKNKTVRQLWDEDPISLLERLSARYNPDNYPHNTEEEKLKFYIYKEIAKEINSIISEFNQEKNYI